MQYVLPAAVVLVILLLGSLFLIKKWLSDLAHKTQTSQEIIEWLKNVSQRVETSTNQVDQKLTENMKNFNQRLDKAAFVIAQVQKNIGEFSEIGRSMKELQELLQSPKLRGNIGETILNDLLTQCLPKNMFVLQYNFKNGEKVDAVIKTSQGLIPIDAKFPIDNFRKMINEEKHDKRDVFKKEFVRDVKKHIHDIARKYIVTYEGTVDYALMYIPAESVYYEVINNAALFDYSRSQRVVVVSPMSFYAYLRVILMSHQGQSIAKRAGEIMAILANLKKDYDKADEALTTLNRHLTNAYNQLSVVSRFFLAFGQKLTLSQMIEGKEEVKKINEPS